MCITSYSYLIALSMNSLLPTIREPTGADNPLDRDKLAESAISSSLDTGVLRAVAALKMRAPSTCSFSPCSFAIFDT